MYRLMGGLEQIALRCWTPLEAMLVHPKDPLNQSKCSNFVMDIINIIIVYNNITKLQRNSWTKGSFSWTVEPVILHRFNPDNYI